MRKVVSGLLIAVVLLSVGLAPFRAAPARAQTSPVTVSCAAGAATTPMPGHYTGSWHSDADYHFLAFGHDIELKVTIDGSLDAIVSPDGHLSGAVQGTVDAPETHDGQKDVSSGHGTISGNVQGVFSPGGSLAVLSQPVIFMRWGTFVGGGYTADRYITMPDYQFPVGSISCVNASGTISEQGFPEQNIVNDFNGGIVQVPGAGAASGTWQLTSDSAAKFTQLSQQVDDLLSQAGALLQGPTTTLTPTLVDQKIAQPLRALEAILRQDPSVARCLLDRIGAWEASVLPTLLQRAQQSVGTDLVSLRHAGDVLRSAALLNLDCRVAQQAATDSVTTAGNILLDNALNAGSWPDLALAIRELYLIGGVDVRSGITARVSAALHARIALAGGVHLLELARIAYVVGDDEDATAAYHRLPATVQASTPPQQPHRPKHKKKKRHPKAKPVATATPLPTATPTPTPKTLAQVLNAGLYPLVTSGSTSAPPSFGWQSIAGATRYIVTVTAAQSNQLLWSWSGLDTTVVYGDTSLPGIAGTGQDAWSGDLPAGYTWSVIALDKHGQIIGAAFRVPS